LSFIILITFNWPIQQLRYFAILTKLLYLANHHPWMAFQPNCSCAMIPLFQYFTTFFASVGMKVAFLKKWGTPKLWLYTKTKVKREIATNTEEFLFSMLLARSLPASCYTPSKLLRRGSILNLNVFSAATDLLQTWSFHCAKSRSFVNNFARCTLRILTWPKHLIWSAAVFPL